MFVVLIIYSIIILPVNLKIVGVGGFMFVFLFNTVILQHLYAFT